MLCPKQTFRFSTQGGPCRLRYERGHRSEGFVLSATKCKTHSEHACYISVPVEGFPLNRFRNRYEANSTEGGSHFFSIFVCGCALFSVPNEHVVSFCRATQRCENKLQIDRTQTDDIFQIFYRQITNWRVTIPRPETANLQFTNFLHKEINISENIPKFIIKIMQYSFMQFNITDDFILY